MILYKLSQSYINRFESHEVSERQSSESNRGENDAQVNTIEVVDSVNSMGDHNSNPWTQGTLRGFRKVRQEEKSSSVAKVTTQEAPVSEETVNIEVEKGEKRNPTNETGRTSYCHFFSNFGYCRYEERTKNKCRFEHKSNVPMCQNGTSCKRHKCEFKHPNSAAIRQNFLRTTQNTADNFQPWQIMHPWMGNNTGQFQYSQGPWVFNPSQVPWVLNPNQGYQQQIQTQQIQSQ